ncbi:TlpA family protein disulfide reductase [Chitinophaga vietnamensis]|uniref:TlpA family protein disulfide reductase n=1 Tax=Chitinophaga vietnamensis TaxID=2593957 RepID=UPI0011779B05|nr:TlpA disulfide reductase family protein [Chitinophaga vietnamensis]
MTRILSLCLLLCSFSAISQTIFKKGDQFLYRIESHYTALTFTQSGKEERIFRVYVTDADKQGHTTGHVTLENALQHMVFTDFDIYYNSSEPSSWQFNSSGMLDDFIFLKIPLHFTIVRDTALGFTQGEAILAAMGKRWGLSNEMTATLLANYRSAHRSMLPPKLFQPAPAEEKAGYTWQYNNGQYRVTAVTPDSVMVACDRTESTDTSATSEHISYVLSRYNHALLRADSKKQFYRHGQPTFVLYDCITQLDPATPLPLVDTALIAVTSRASSFSQALKVNGEYDSTRIAQYAAENDPRFGNNGAYLLGIAHAWQQARHYQEYSQLLDRVPDSLLKGQNTHLFNKLQNVYERNADTASRLAGMLKGSSLHSWIHDSFFQGLQARQPVAAELLERLHASADKNLQMEIDPLYRWYTATNTTDTATLKKLAATFGQEKTDEVLKGKAGRYAMLTYSLLQDAGLHTAAGALLDRTINSLKGAMEDTATKRDDRNVSRYLLSHAWYLKYKAALPANKEAAMGYLAHAAELTPASPKDRAHGSSYDQEFLNGQEDYSQLFASELSSMGEKEAAMKVISKSLQFAPDRLDSTIALFRRQFPGRSFTDFLKTVVIKSWEAAPDFDIPNLDKGRHKLSDYRGKWLLLDFWGSWCGPCRADLPQLQQVADDAISGKLPRTAVLAVACREELAISRKFLQQHQYHLVSGYSDGRMEKDYKVAGYPTKVLISPEGKMLTLQFGKDYRSILEAFNNAYFQPEQASSALTPKEKD